MKRRVLLFALCFRFIYGFGIVVTLPKLSTSNPPRENQNTCMTMARLESEVVNDDAFLPLHHVAIRTRNITLAIDFYGLLGFEPITKFRAGPARAAWLQQRITNSTTKSNTRLELIEVPSYILNEPEGMKRRALDLFERQDLLGLNHFAVDVSTTIKESKDLFDLSDYLNSLNEKSLILFGKTLRIALQPKQQLIGKSVYELAFLYDADGSLVELLNKEKELPQDIDSGWEPWDGKGFVQ